MAAAATHHTLHHHHHHFGSDLFNSTAPIKFFSNLEDLNTLRDSFNAQIPTTNHKTTETGSSNSNPNATQANPNQVNMLNSASSHNGANFQNTNQNLSSNLNNVCVIANGLAGLSQGQNAAIIGSSGSLQNNQGGGSSGNNLTAGQI